MVRAIGTKSEEQPVKRETILEFVSRIDSDPAFRYVPIATFLQEVSAWLSG